MARQGKCWTYNLSHQSQQGTNYLEKSKKFGNDKCPNITSCPYETLYSSLGMSVHAAGDEVIFGAPGSYTWKGTMAAKRHFPPSHFQLGDRVKDDPRSIYDYSGYSVGSGFFQAKEVGSTSTRSRQYIVGAPRAGTKREGEVYIIKKFPLNDNKKQNIKILQTLSGTQLGEYFGASFAAVDIDGDGLDDLVVGSPLSTTDVEVLNGIENKFLNKLNYLIESEKACFKAIHGGHFCQGILKICRISCRKIECLITSLHNYN